MSRSSTGSRVYVGGLVDSVRKEDLEKEFSKFGKLNHVWVAWNPPGFAFIEFDDERDAQEAVRAMNGQDMCGSRLRVELSRGRGRGGGGGGGMRGGSRGGRGGRGGRRDSRGGGGRGGGGGGGGMFRGSGGSRGGGGGGGMHGGGGGGRGGMRDRGRSSFGGGSGGFNRGARRDRYMQNGPSSYKEMSSGGGGGGRSDRDRYNGGQYDSGDGYYSSRSPMSSSYRSRSPLGRRRK
uniref:RRM domain-containing protein n=1 Tax=Strigamia maritima TaxID=126957 RepID=T1JJJ1_STRMM